MKNKCLLLLSVLAVSIFSGCASVVPNGVLYTEVTVPSAASSSAKATKVGKSYCKSYLGMVSLGDASIETAKKNGGITEVVSVDWKVKNILGLIGEYECIVTGN
ncbi:MAG: TRL-like family protein [Opitutales bacterium]